MENGNIKNSQITASSQWDGNHAAIQGRLNYKKNGPKQGGWSARTNDLNQWLQIDLINKFNVVTRVATQGRNAYNQWVTKYMLQFSDDGIHFQYYRGEGKASYMEFAGNTDPNTVVAHHLNPPIDAGYIRFLPTAWHKHVSMRVELYGCKVCEKPLGMEDGRIANGQISASSEWDPNHAAIQGRLNFKQRGAKQGAWSARANNVNQWLQVDLGCHHTLVTRVATQGRNKFNQWVTRYMLQYSNDGIHFQYYREHGHPNYKVFSGNKNRDTIVSHLLSSPIEARFLRIRPLAWYGHISMRVELYGCGGNYELNGNTDRDTVVYHKLNPSITARYIRFRPVAWHRHISMRMEIYGCEVCNHALGMEDRGISNWQITSSSQWDSNHAAIQGRLFFQAAGRKRGAWSARANNINQWLQIDLGCEDNIVTRVATQGRNAINQWVTKYMLQYSNNDAHFEYYREQGRSQIKVFTGNSNRDTVVSHPLHTPIEARYIRFRPRAWHGHISMRVELYGCKSGIYGLQMKMLMFGTILFLSGAVVLGSSITPEVSKCDKSFGIENGNIENSQITASSQWDSNHAAIQGRLNYKKNGPKQGGWSARTNNLNQWLQIDLINKYNKVTRIATQGRNGADQWVTKYMLQYSNDRAHFQFHREEGKASYRVFIGNTDRDTVVTHHLNPPIRAHYVRFLPKSWHRHISMRVELYGCKVCNKPLGMEDGRISNGQISASSEWDANHAAIQGRLNFKQRGAKQGAWSARANNVNQWLQVDLGCQYTRVSHVATQGRNGYNQWVTRYMLQHGSNELHFLHYREHGQPDYKVFAGNTDRDTIVSHLLSSPVSARFIRFLPTAWHGHVSMRVEIYGCGGNQSE
ncbi:uncharacterized protein LOC113672335 [Pocillopora damicornis]|uniref:uncharacterized protein LOC113672335 n=1 Tax=Pocillopora damicornis TaxID=46731 RepID=UPI000F54E371|nr:uncharacterized protein LOC113672335 [Pocillopora damicornis]